MMVTRAAARRAILIEGNARDQAEIERARRSERGLKLEFPALLVKVDLLVSNLSAMRFAEAPSFIRARACRNRCTARCGRWWDDVIEMVDHGNRLRPYFAALKM
jgi:hypothetical protein